MIKKIIFLLFLVCPLFVYSEDLTIVYTGNSYANLYPCGHCPASVGGGVTRRATVIKQIREKTPNVLVVDSGNFTAGGALDESSVDPEHDQVRTVYNYQAMQQMGYDVAILGQAELNFGVDFIKNNLFKNNFKVISANVKSDSIISYYTKKIGKISVAIIGVSPQDVYKSKGFTTQNYSEALKQTLKELASKVNFIILGSSLGDKANIDLAKEFPSLKVILSSGESSGVDLYEKIGDTLIFKPSTRAKDLRVIKLNIENGKIVNFNASKESLALTVKEDEEMVKKIPACFKDIDCGKKDKLVSRCENAGAKNAQCSYNEANPIEAVLITDTNCLFCSVDFPKKILKNNFLGITFKAIDYRSEEAKKNISQYNIDVLPAFILPLTVKDEKNFPKVENFLNKQDNQFFIKKELAGVFLFLKRQEIAKDLVLFLNIYDDNALKIFNDLKDFSLTHKIDFKVNLVIPEFTDNDFIRDETAIALAIKKSYPDKFIPYLTARLENIKSIDWLGAVESVGLDYKKIKELIKPESVKQLLAINNKLNEELSVRNGNIILVNNNRVFKVFKIKTEDLERFYK